VHSCHLVWGSSEQLREYLPNARGVAKNELLVQQRLCGELPQEKWQVSLAYTCLCFNSDVKRSAGCGWCTAPCT
jgi:hypothetical protein